MNGNLKWIIPAGAAIVLGLGGLVYASVDGRIKNVEAAMPILYEIRAQSRRNGEDIQKLLGRREDDTPN